MENVNRSAYRGQVTRIANGANDYLKSPQSQPSTENEDNWYSIEEELSVLLHRLKTAYDGLIKANSEYVHTGKVEEQLKDSEMSIDYEDKAVSVIARLNQRLERLQRMRKKDSAVSSAPTQSRENSNGIRLPKLDLKTFSGDYREWLPFWEQFKTAVHENSLLSGADKFNYLQSSLKGSAADVIAGFTPSGNCYDGALALLQEEFGNNDKLIDKNMNEMMSISSLSSRTDLRGLRHMYNTVTSSIRSLAALGIASSSYSIMLKSKLIRCLPSELRANYFRTLAEITIESDSSTVDAAKSSESERSINLSGDKQIQNILKFIKREIVALENSLEERDNRRQQKTHLTAAGLLSTSHTQKSCYFCKSSSHVTRDCDGLSTLMQRKNMLKRDGRCFRCTSRGHSAKRCTLKYLRCSICKGWHAKAMCDPDYRRQLKESVESHHLAQSVNLYTANMRKNSPNVLLQTASVFISNTAGNISAYVRIILDGGSQMTFVKESMVEKLALEVVGSRNISVIPFGSEEKHLSEKKYNIVRLKLTSQYGKNAIELEAVVVPTICADVLEVSTEQYSSFRKIALADTRLLNCHREEGISILIGADNYWRIATGHVKRIDEGLMAIDTIFGWTLQGPILDYSATDRFRMASVLQVGVFDEKAMWDLEIIGIKSTTDESNSFTYKFMDSCITKRNDRYEVCLPWKNDASILDDNKVGALSRFNTLIRKLSRSPAELIRYDKAMWDLIHSGVAERVTRDENVRKYYMPHRGVYREDKSTSKLRIVFDASAHAEHCLSLNENLLSGANLLPDIFKILLNFRLGSIGLVADIEKAFLQISVSERDRDALRFFWFSTCIDSYCSLPEIQTFRMTRVTFGVTSSPFLLAATLKHHLRTECERYPETCAILNDSFYVDDVVCSVDDEESALQFYHQSINVLSGAAMNLRKWNSNHPSIRQSLTTVPPDIQKVLGMVWYVQTDELVIDLDIVLNALSSIQMYPTKRLVLQIISRFYDPLGFFGPFRINFKILFQTIWRRKLEWDDLLPDDLMRIWKTTCAGIVDLKKISMPRCAFDNTYGAVLSKDLHVFADASQSGYGAVAYLRSTHTDGKITVRFLCAKNRVAPLKTIDALDNLTLPKLELTAALIAARLCSYLVDNLKVVFNHVCLWTDSKISLCWIKNETKKRWKPYVANRVHEIQSLTASFEWSHCPGKQNPADLLTRGVTARFLVSSDSWRYGPTWLRRSRDNWPNYENPVDLSQINSLPTFISLQLTVAETSKTSFKEAILRTEDYSSWKRMLRVTAYVMRFVMVLKGKCVEHRDQVITAEELQMAERYWLKNVQWLAFEDEIKALQRGIGVNKSSTLYSLNPFLDGHGLLRVNSRLGDAERRTLEAFPIILPKHSHVSKLIALHTHQQLLHCGTNATLAQLRNKFWIVKGRQLVKGVISRCFVCKRLLALPGSQPFAPLPLERMMMSRPFDMTGIDYAGPLYIQRDAVDRSSEKVYILLFTCGSTRAVHLELVTDLTTECCLLALRRFFARRGKPSIIYSDNAKTFKSASRELKTLNDITGSGTVKEFVNNEGIRWKFIVERAAWWGGFWERLIRSIKVVLKVAIGRSVLKIEELRTFLVEVESVINARPLTYITDDPKDLNPLTPSHFLTGMVASPDAVQLDEPLTGNHLRVNWNSRMKALKLFWKRWKLEYLQELRTLHHSKKGRPSSDIRPGDVVIIHDPSLPKTLWKLALVEQVFPGRDNRVRACQVRLANGTSLRRPVQLLYSLEVR